MQAIATVTKYNNEKLSQNKGQNKFNTHNGYRTCKYHNQSQSSIKRIHLALTCLSNSINKKLLNFHGKFRAFQFQLPNESHIRTFSV